MSDRIAKIVAGCAIVAFATLAFINAATTSPTSDELVHLAAGLSYLKTGDFRLNREHPPLLKTIAALPLAATPLFPDPARAADAATRLRDAWDRARTDNGSQWRFSRMFFYGVTDAALQRTSGNNDALPSLTPFVRSDYIHSPEAMFLRARTMMILVAVALAIVIFAWSKQLWGAWGGAVSTLLFAFDPNFIAHSGLVTTDVGIAMLMTATVFFFWKALHSGSNIHRFAFVLCFSLAFVAKFSAALLIPIVIAIALTTRRWRPFALIAIAGVSSLIVVWAAYGFQSGSAVEVHGAVHDWAARRAAIESFPQGIRQEDVDRVWGTIPLSFVERTVVFADRINLLPETYLFGFASTAGTSIGRPSFVNGKFSLTGSYGYFGWTTLYKLPILTLIAIAAGLALGWRTKSRYYALLPVAIYLGVAIGSRMNIGHRHILPVFPFLYVLAGSIGPHLARRRILAVAAIAGLALTANVALFPRPQSLVGRHLSYVNELALGPLHGFRKVNDSNFDWGQDLGRLGDWLRIHDVTEPVNLVYFGTADPRFYGVRFYDLRPTTLPMKVPGYLAISTTDYIGVLFSPDRHRYWERFVDRTDAKLVGRAGYSILIFRVERLP